jgi:hypothetical protein
MAMKGLKPKLYPCLSPISLVADVCQNWQQPYFYLREGSSAFQNGGLIESGRSRIQMSATEALFGLRPSRHPENLTQPTWIWHWVMAGEPSPYVTL